MSNTNIQWKVYKLTSPTGRVYIGCTHLDLEQRWQSGRNYRNNHELFDDIISYGWNTFSKELVFSCDDELDARRTEHQLIQSYPNGYNIYRGRKYQSSGNPPSPPKRVRCVETNKIFDSVHLAAATTGLSRVKISECCNGKRKRTGGYHWQFL